jgi:Leucine-rich repeat (LRR) protein
LPLLPKLKVLNLSDNHLTQIVKIGDFVTLEELNISGYNAAIKSIAPIFKLRKLKKLTVQNISYQQVELLKKYLPNTELIVK